MNGEQLRAALHAGKRAYGTLIVSDSPRWPATVKGLGMDFVFIDTEHIAIDRGKLSWMCQTYAGLDLAPIVRIPSPNPYEACVALDGGAQGVVAPYIETAEQVRCLVGAVKRRPLKGARLASHLEGQALEPPLAEYVERNNAQNCLIVNIESVPAMDALDEILSVEGLDAVFIGPHDLSCSLGLPEQYHHPDFEQAVEEIIAKSRARGVGVGIHVTYADGMEQEIRLCRLGANFIVHWADILAFQYCMRGELATLKSALGDDGPAESTGDTNI